tara:strand:- start:310 stop:627 length:318 start_codon:yes stop_codon:yes gene_type:complete
MPRLEALVALLILATCIVPLAGCADYVSRADTITIGAGSAMRANAAIMTVDPQAEKADNVTIEADGRAVEKAMKEFRKGKTGDEKGTSITLPPSSPDTDEDGIER